MRVAHLGIHFVTVRERLHASKVLDDRLEGGLVDRRKPAKATSKLAELVVNVYIWIVSDEHSKLHTSAFAVLDAVCEREGKYRFRQLA